MMFRYWQNRRNRVLTVLVSGLLSLSVAPTLAQSPSPSSSPATTPSPTASPKPVASPKPTTTPKPTASPKPAATPKPKPTTSPKPTSSPASTPKPSPTGTNQAVPATGNELVIQVDGLRSRDGKVCVTLYNSDGAADFPNNESKAFRHQCSPITNNLAMRITFKDMPTGRYAIALLHDANGDGTPNRVNGIPSEGFGFSQNPVLDVAAPKFEATAFSVEGPKTMIKINVTYLQ
jgi:uncharacterized protein (DUF2141 family)